jgi:putative membrane protein
VSDATATPAPKNRPEPGTRPEPENQPAPEPADQPARGAAARLVLAAGTEPDPRFTLANERTFLAWIRTALGLMAGGIAVEAFTTDLFPDGVRQLIAVLLLALAMLITAAACFRWVSVERAMRTRSPLPLPFLVPLLALGTTVVAAVVVVFVLLRQV